MVKKGLEIACFLWYIAYKRMCLRKAETFDLIRRSRDVDKRLETPLLGVVA